MAGGAGLRWSVALTARAGQRHRLMQGVGRSGNEDGPLHDLPDWEFADGTPAPTTRKQRTWQIQRQKTAARINRLRKEVIEMEQKELELMLNKNQ